MRKTPFLVLAIVAACGGDKAVAFEQLSDEIISANCANQVACGLMPDQATCEESVFLDGGLFDTLGNLIADGTVRYDGGAAGRCVDAIAGQGCLFQGLQPIDDPCDDILAGTIAPGGACIDSFECEGLGRCEPTDANCDPNTACCAGSCVAAPELVAIGGNCDQADCVDGAFCNVPETGAAICTALVTQEGAACTDLFACANPMICDLDFATNMGTCLTPAVSNADCVADELIPCSDLRDYCDTATSKCVRESAVGAACSPDIDCIGFATCVAATCTADPGLGDTCDPNGMQDCLGGLDCAGTTCAAPADGGSPVCGG